MFARTYYWLLAFVVSATFSSVVVAEQIIWRHPPSEFVQRFPDQENESDSPGLGTIKQYLLAQVMIDDESDPDFGQPGIIDQVTTYFDEMSAAGGVVDFSTLRGAVLNKDGFYQVSATARLNVFVVDDASTELPSNVFDNPFTDGIEVQATFIHNTDSDWVEVCASNLIEQLLDMGLSFRIKPDTCYYIGLTPIFTTSPAPFTGEHLANLSPLEGDVRSAARQIDPMKEDWVAAAGTGGEELFATIELRGPPQPDIYLSFSDFDDDNAPANITIDTLVGDSISVHVWVNEWYEIDTGAGLDVSTTTTGVIAFTAAESFEADILVAGFPVDVRWGVLFGPASSVSADFIEGLNAATMSIGTGILPSQITGSVLEDAWHDSAPQTGAFLFGRVELDVVGPGTTILNLSAGSLGIVNDGLALGPKFGAVTINATTGLLGDVNCDGVVSLLDVAPFVDLVISGMYLDKADINMDGVVDLLDVTGFLALITGS